MSETIVYSGARLISGDSVIENGEIAVRDGKILRIGSASGATPAVVVDWTGKTVIPAIVNPHGHIGYMQGTSADARFYSRENVIDHLHRLAYYGISTFQSLGTDRDDVEIGVRDDQRAGRLGVGYVAELLTAGVGIVAPTPGGLNGGPFFATDVVYEAKQVEGARAHVRRLAAKDVDTVKVWLDDRNGTKAKLPPAIVEAVVDEAHAHGIPVAAHIYSVDDAKTAVQAGADVLAHLPRTGVDSQLIKMLRERDTAVFTSLSIQRPPGEEWLEEAGFAEILPRPEVEALRRVIRQHAPEPLYDTGQVYQRMQRTVIELAEAGVRLVFSADTGLLAQIVGYAEHRELEALVAAGLSPLTALKMATEASSTLLGLFDRGALRPGARADLLVLDADPRHDITATRRISEVYLAGERVDRPALRDRWRKRIAPEDRM